MDENETQDTDEVEEEEAEEEETRGDNPAPETKEPEENTAPKTFDELKIIINLKGENMMLGVQSPDCDPVYTTLKGTLAAALKKVPKLVKDAKQQWTSNPQYPKADLPEPAPAPATSTATKSSAKPDKKQPSFF